MEEREDADEAARANGVAYLAEASPTKPEATFFQDEGKPEPVGASSYDFFASGPADDALEELGGLEGGLEEGVEAPPEEEILDAGLEDLDLHVGGSEAAIPRASTPSEASVSNMQTTGSLGGGQSLLQHPRESETQQRAGVARGSVPSSFLSDPVAGPPSKSGGMKTWHIGSPGSAGAAQSFIDNRGRLGTGFGSLLSSSSPASGSPTALHSQQWSDAQGQPGLARISPASLQSQNPPLQNNPISGIHPSQQLFGARLAPQQGQQRGQPLGGPTWQQQQQQQVSGQLSQSPQSQQFWMQRSFSGGVGPVQSSPSPASLPSRAMTVEELEARMLSGSSASLPKQPPQQHMQSPGQGSGYSTPRMQLAGSPAPPFPMLSRQSASFSRSPGNHPRQTFSLPAGISLSGGVQGIQQSLANAGLGGSSGMNPSPRTQHMMQLASSSGRHSPLGSQSFQGSVGSSVGRTPSGLYGQLTMPMEQRQGSSSDFALQQQQQQQQIMRQRQQQMSMQPQGGRGYDRGFGRGFGPQYGPGIGAGNFFRPPMGDPMLHGSLMRRRSHGSKYMDSEEIESILRIQWKSLHSGSPYLEDYYYQAFVSKYGNGINQMGFAPDALRDLAPSEKLGAEPAMYVKLEGLGKIAYSNIRRPRPLMDLVAEPIEKDTPTKETAGDESEKPVVKPLEEEPLLAARIVIEDCMCLLLDIDDIDRVWLASSGLREDEHLLRQRRSLLMDAFASSLRLPDGALPPAGTGRASDAVFMRLMAIHKGRSLLARALQLLTAPLASPAGYAGPAGRRPPPLRIVWAALRNVRLLFSVTGASAAAPNKEDEQVVAQRMIRATSQIAASAVNVMRRLETPRAICDCMAALVQGDLASKGSPEPNHADNLLPLTPTGEAAERQGEWLAEVIVALLQRAQQLGLADWASQRSRNDGLAVPEGLAWQDCYSAFFNLLARHLRTLAEVCRLAIQAGALPAANYAKQIVPIALIRASLPHATEGQRDQIRAILSQLA